MSHETFMGRRPRKPGFEVTVTTLAPIKGLEIEEDDGEAPLVLLRPLGYLSY